MDNRAKVKRICQCMMCGIRIAGSKSPFCRVEAKTYGVKLVPMKLTPHRWVWARQVRTSKGVSMEGLEFI